jgi:hypothetical protein
MVLTGTALYPVHRPYNNTGYKTLQQHYIEEQYIIVFDIGNSILLEEWNDLA